MPKKYLFAIVTVCLASVALLASSYENNEAQLLYKGDIITVDISAEIVPQNSATKYAMQIVNDDQLQITVTDGVVQIVE